MKNRPRIPTPDVTKEVVDREQRLALSASNAVNINAAVIGMSPPPAYQPNNAATGGGAVVGDDFSLLPITIGATAAGLVLSPIQGINFFFFVFGIFGSYEGLEMKN